MMLLTSLSRLALVGCLLAIITALILPRRHNLALILQDVLPKALLVRLNQLAPGIHDQPQEPAREPPRSHPQDIIRKAAGQHSGQTLRSRTGLAGESGRKSSSTTAHSYFVQTPESGFHSPSGRQTPAVDHLTGAAGHGAGQRLGQAAQPVISLTVFTITVIALILYTGMRMLITKSGQHQHQQPPTKFLSGNQSHFCKFDLAHEMHNGTHSGATSYKPDTRLRRKLATTSNKDERTRELILHHGAKNVSQAIKFLMDELEKQRHELASSPRNLSEEQSGDTLSSPCSCTCHQQQRHHSTSPLTGQLPTPSDTITTPSATANVSSAAP